MTGPAPGPEQPLAELETDAVDRRADTAVDHTAVDDADADADTGHEGGDAPADGVGEPEAAGPPLAEGEPVARRRSGRRSWLALMPSDAVSRVLLGVIALMIACVAVFGSIIATSYPLWSPVDENAHFVYVQYVAEHGGLPVLGHEYMPLSVLEQSHTFSVKTWGTNPRTMGLVGEAYEDFQPPLYYVLAVPAYELGGSLHAKAVMIRFFDLALMLVAIALFARLCRQVLKERWLFGLATGMLVFAMPGFLVRGVIISNLPLLIPLAIACVSALWSAWEKSSARHLIWAGVFLGLGILSDLFAMALVPGFVIVAAILLWRKHDRREVGLVTLAAGLGALLVIPWIIFNEVHFHAVTAQSVVEALQGSAVNPHHVHYSLGFAAFQIVATLFQPVPPQDVAFGNHGVLLWLAQMLGVFLIPVPLVLGVSMGRRLFDGGTWMLALPFVAAVALCVGFTVGEQWLSMVPRYTYLGLPLLALFLAAAALGVLRDLRPYLVTVCGFAVFLAVLWIVLVPHIRAA